MFIRIYSIRISRLKNGSKIKNILRISQAQLFILYTKICNDAAQSCNAKNILRINEAENCQKVKNTEAETKKHYPYKKKRVVLPDLKHNNHNSQ